MNDFDLVGENPDDDVDFGVDTDPTPSTSHLVIDVQGSNVQNVDAHPTQQELSQLPAATGNECPICRVNVAEIAFTPCGHIYLLPYMCADGNWTPEEDAQRSKRTRTGSAERTVQIGLLGVPDCRRRTTKNISSLIFFLFFFVLIFNVFYLDNQYGLNSDFDNHHELT